MPGSVYDNLEHNRKDRIHIKYEVETEGKTEIKDLPFMVGVLADLSGDATKPLKPLSQRTFTKIDRDNFDEVLAKQSPGLSLRVTDALHAQANPDAPKKDMNVNLEFKEMADFDPANVANQVPALQKLMAARSRLNELLGKIERSDKLESLLEQVLKNTENLEKMVGKDGSAKDGE